MVYEKDITIIHVSTFMLKWKYFTLSVMHVLNLWNVFSQIIWFPETEALLYLNSLYSSSYCCEHRPQQTACPDTEETEVTCAICMNSVFNRPCPDTLKSPCCRGSWFHRVCIQVCNSYSVNTKGIVHRIKPSSPSGNAPLQLKY